MGLSPFKQRHIGTVTGDFKLLQVKSLLSYLSCVPENGVRNSQ